MSMPKVEVRESDEDVLARMGIDGQKWAEEFHKKFATFHKEGDTAIIDKRIGIGTLYAWFANAIEAGRSHERNKFPTVEIWKDPASRRHYVKTEANGFVAAARFNPITDEVAESIDDAIKKSLEMCDKREEVC